MTDTLHALRTSLEAAADALRTVDSSDSSAAFDHVVAVDDALSEVAGFADAVRALLSAVPSGRAVSARIGQGTAALTALHAEVTQTRTELERLRQIEAELAGQAAEHDRLTGEVVELQRLERLAAELPALHRQHVLLTEQATSLAAGAELLLSEAAGELQVLSEEQSALLAPRVRSALAESIAAQERLAAARQDLRTHTGELEAAVHGFGELSGLRDSLLASARVYQGLDQDLLDGLSEYGAGSMSGLERARTALVEVTERLEELDSVLAVVLDGHVRAYEEAHRVLDWADRG